MNDFGRPLSLLIVSDDWLQRELLARLARETRHFSSVSAVDGARAFAHTMDAVTAGFAPNVFLLDQHSLGSNADRFALELRTQPVTRSAFIASLRPDEARSVPELDFQDATPPGDSTLADVVNGIGRRALDALHAHRAA